MHFVASLGGAIWRLGWRIGRSCRRREGSGDPRWVPLIRIGSLRAGGGGRTTVAASLARTAADLGLRTALLSYDLRRVTRSGRPVAVDPARSWREQSDDAVVLQQESGVPVFLTRDFFAAWRELSSSGEWDLVIADGGLEDPRLATGETVLLRRSDEPDRLRWRDLLPFGKYRSFPEDCRGGGTVVWKTVAGGKVSSSPFVSDSSVRGWIEGVVNRVPSSVEREEEMVFGVDCPPATVGKKGVAVTGAGDPSGTVALLRQAGWEITAVRSARDHSDRIVSQVRQELQTGTTSLLVSHKDGVKLPPELLSDPRVIVFRFAIGRSDRL